MHIEEYIISVGKQHKNEKQNYEFHSISSLRKFIEDWEQERQNLVNSSVSGSKIYGKEKAISLEEAKKIISEYPNEDDYVQAHFQNGLGGYNEYWDNTIDTSNYWNKCRKIVEL